MTKLYIDKDTLEQYSVADLNLLDRDDQIGTWVEIETVANLNLTHSLKIDRELIK